MIQDQNRRSWPSQSGSSTLTFQTYFRGNTDVGSYSPTPGISALALVFPLGRSEAATLSELREAMVMYLLNNGIASVWQPQSGDTAGELRAALSSWTPSTFVASTTCYLFFNGQFGPVLVG